MASIKSSSSSAEVDQITPWYIIGALGALVVVSYWNTIATGSESFFGAWMSPQYSHGFLVPLFAGVLIAMRREPFREVTTVERWGGVAIIGAGLALRLIGSFYHIVTFDMVSIIPVLIGVFVVAGGWSVLRWAGPPLAFLLFMIPLPTAAERSMLIPLQSVATKISTYSLQTLGVPDAFNQANRISIGNGIELNVEEACSGLRMATIFLAMAVALTMISDRSWWEKAIVILSAIPIALIVNMVRIVVTAVLYLILGQDSELAQHFFHDLAGWFMMPLALALLYGETILLSHIFIDEERLAPQPTGYGSMTTSRRPVSTR